MAEDPNRAITLCDEAGNVIVHHDPLPEQPGPTSALRSDTADYMP